MTQGKNTSNKPKTAGIFKKLLLSTLRLQNTELEKIFISYNNLFIHRVLVCKQKNIKKVTAINITCTEKVSLSSSFAEPDPGPRAGGSVI